MCTTIKRWLTAAYLFYERLKGDRTVHEVGVRQSVYGHLTGYSISGYEIQLFCHKKQYQRRYARWFVPNRDYVMYRVFSNVSHEAPAHLKEVCELDISVPAMVPDFVGERVQKEVAVQAYLDILIDRLKPV